MNKKIAFVWGFSLMSSLVGCSDDPAQNSSPAIETQTESIMSADRLIDFAVADFKANQPPVPRDFRHVRYGIINGADNARRSILCGEFLAVTPSGADEWSAFSTLQTDEYEQWLGAQASPLCQQTTIVWDGRDDYAEVIERKFNQ